MFQYFFWQIKKTVVTTLSLVFLFFAPSFALAKDTSIQMLHLPPKKFVFSYEIYAPKGIDSPDKKYFYVVISITQEVIETLGNESRTTATAYFPCRSAYLSPFIKVAETHAGLHEIERRDLPPSSLQYLMTKKAIHEAIREYYREKEKYSKSQKITVKSFKDMCE